MYEKHLEGTGRVYYEEGSFGKYNPYGVSIVSRNSLGQGTGLDLYNLTPTDLRVIADFLEKRLAEKHMVK